MASLDRHGEPVNDATGSPPRRVYWRGRQWCVTDYGLETNVPDRYYVEAHQLGELTLHRREKNEPILERIRHVTEKRWVDIEDLFAAFAVACVVHGVDAPMDALLNSMADARRGRWMDKAFAQEGTEVDRVYSLSEMMSVYDVAGARLRSYMAETGRDFREVDEGDPEEPRCF